MGKYRHDVHVFLMIAVSTEVGVLLLIGDLLLTHPYGEGALDAIEGAGDATADAVLDTREEVGFKVDAGVAFDGERFAELEETPGAGLAARLSALSSFYGALAGFCSITGS